MIQGYWIQEFAASLLNYAQKTKIQNHNKNTRYKSKCFHCCTRVSLHFKVPFGLNSTCDKITSFTLLLFMIQYFTINHGLFFIMSSAFIPWIKDMFSFAFFLLAISLMTILLRCLPLNKWPRHRNKWYGIIDLPSELCLLVYAEVTF